jgi:hypothetical protein
VSAVSVKLTAEWDGSVPDALDCKVVPEAFSRSGRSDSDAAQLGTRVAVDAAAAEQLSLAVAATPIPSPRSCKMSARILGVPWNLTSSSGPKIKVKRVSACESAPVGSNHTHRHPAKVNRIWT